MAVTVALVLVGGACSGGTPQEDDPPPAGPTVLAPTEDGPDPLVPVEGGDAPSDLVPVITRSDEAARAAGSEAETPDGERSDSEALRRRLLARLDAAVAVFTDDGVPLVRPRSVAGAAVAPARRDAACDRLPDLVAGDDRAAAVVAEVAGLQPEDVADHLSSLTPGYLIADTVVISHRLRAGAPQPYRAVLAAGTAVLVDADGLPRIRCRSGTPLLPAVVEVDDLLLDATAFADRVLEAEIGADVPAEPVTSVDGTFTASPDAALGPPDGIAVSLGEDPGAGTGRRCATRIVVELVDNRLVDGPGPDLLVVEQGRPETTGVAVGPSPDDLRPVGPVDGGIARIDLADVLGTDERASVIELCDGADTSSEVAGSDIDAVAALHSVDPRS